MSPWKDEWHADECDEEEWYDDEYQEEDIYVTEEGQYEDETDGWSEWYEQDEPSSTYVQPPTAAPSAPSPADKGKSKGKGKGKGKGKSKGKGKPRGPSAEHPCSICRSPDHWARECPRKTEEETKKYEAQLCLYGHMEGELLYMFDCLFASTLKYPSFAAPSMSPPAHPPSGPPADGPGANSE